MNRGCSIFFMEGHIGVSPTVLNLERVLGRNGVEVTIFAARSPYPAPTTLAERTQLRLLVGPADSRLGRRALAVLRRLRLGSSIPGLLLLVYAVQCGLKGLVRGRKVARGPSIGVDSSGSILAFLRRLVTGAPYVYLSLELQDPRHTTKLSAFINPLERAAYRRAEAVVIQDEDRLRTLTTYLDYVHPRPIFLPNAPFVDEQADEVGSSYLRENLGIQDVDYPVVVLQAGMIDEAAYSEELARSFSTINRGWALVFHERMKRSDRDPYITRIRDANSVNLFLSLEPVPMDELDLVIESATIGLAFYREVDPNFGQIASASGKLGYYLKHGKPVLVSNSPSLAGFVERSGAGLVVQNPADPAEIEAAIDSLLRGYDRYSSNARAYFDQHLDFDRLVQPLLGVLDLGSSGAAVKP